MPNVSHVGFADESRYNEGRYRCVSLVTLRAEDYEQTQDRLVRLLGDSNVSEFKWTEVDDARYRFAALKLATLAVEAAAAGTLRVDTLIWDIEDSRHDVPGRDDMANLGRMLYWIIRITLDRRWPDASTWAIHPDRQNGVDWSTLRDVLSTVGRENGYRHLDDEIVRTIGRKLYDIELLEPMPSESYPLIQLADLFAGMAAYSKEHYDTYEAWSGQQGDQTDLSQWSESEGPSFSNADEERCQVLDQFHSMCKEKKLQVSLNSYNGLETREPTNPLNFWLWRPQHEEDKAPT